MKNQKLEKLGDAWSEVDVLLADVLMAHLKVTWPPDILHLDVVLGIRVLPGLEQDGRAKV